MRPSKARLAASAASRANGARSHGPTSAEGKRRSSLNAIRHGLLAKAVVLRNESEECFAQLLARHLSTLSPVDDLEHAVIEEMVACNWRIRRPWTIEKRLFDNSMAERPETDERDRLAHAWSDLAAGSTLKVIVRYESKLHSAWRRSLTNLISHRELEKSEFDETNLDFDNLCQI